MFISAPLRSRVWPLLLIICLVLHFAPRAHADTPQAGPRFIVTNTADPGDGTCGSTTCALRDAIHAANKYGGTQGRAVTISFDPLKFGPKQTITLAQGELDINSNLTLINAAPGVSVTLDARRKSRVFTIESGLTVVIAGLNIINGESSSAGGGIYNSASPLTVNNCILSSNHSSVAGGGIANAGTLTVNQSVLARNSAVGPGSPTGGGILNGGTLTINNSNLSGNSAIDGGGGVANGGTLTITNSTLANNRATRDGGALLNNGTLTLHGSTLAYNGVGNGGGGIYNDTGRLTVDNSTLAHNSARFGGGIFNYGTLNLSSSTIAANSAGGSGGGLYNDNKTVSLSNSIVAGNTASSSPDIFGAITRGDYNLVQTPFGATLSGTHNILGQNPQLGPLASNGGPTQTFALGDNSPAINAGDPNIQGAPATDQRNPNYARISDGRIDIGAYEFHGVSNLVLTGAAHLTGTSASPTVTYTLTLTNIGPNAARSVTLTDDLPTSATLISWTQTGGPAGMLSSAPRQVTARLDTVAPGNAVTFTLVLRATGKSTLVNVARVTTPTTETDLTNNTATSTLTFDHTPPTISIVTPAPNAQLKQLTLVSGQAADGPGGTGVQQVALYLIRVTDGKNFDGTTFVTPPPVNGQAQPIALTTSYDPQHGIWARRMGLPTAADLTPGTYRILAVATDGAGNRASATSSFTVPASAGVKLSSATANVANSSLTLHFTGALDAATAGDVAHYVVSVNDYEVTVASAAYNAARHSVTLDLTPGALQDGAQVTIAWHDLRDATGQAITDGTVSLRVP